MVKVRVRVTIRVRLTVSRVTVVAKSNVALIKLLPPVVQEYPSRIFWFRCCL